MSELLTGAEPIAVSAINQYAYCPRRCALIFMDREFENNIHTQRGTDEHDRADTTFHICDTEGVRLEYALPVWSRRLGLSGRCDVVEFHPDGTVYPVEYKHGKKQKWLNDDLQVAAQALCLEEMLGRPVPKGAIFHASSHRRREVAITVALRELVVQTAGAIRAMLSAGTLPAPVFDARCRECSLKDICQPEALTATATQRAMRAHLFDPED